MRCERCLVGDQVAFAVLDLDKGGRGAAYELGWQEVAGGMGVTFPSQTRYLDRAYLNFEMHAPTMIRQSTNAEALPWRSALAATLAALHALDIEWYLVGSAALAVRGIEVMPGDIDLVTDAEGAHVLEDALQEWLVQPLVVSPGWIAESFTRAFVGMRVEWVGGVDAAVDKEDRSDFGPAAAARLEKVWWEGHALWVPPIDLQLAGTRRRGRDVRVQQIEQWMERQERCSHRA